MSAQSVTFFAGSSLAARFSEVRARLAEAAAKRKVYHTTLAELQSLSARDLADLGMAPSSVQEIAYKAAYGD